MLFRWRFFLMAAMAAAVGLVGPSTGQAAFSIGLASGSGPGSTFTILDNTGQSGYTGPDRDTTEGIIETARVSAPGNALASNVFMFQGYAIGITTETSQDPATAMISTSTYLTIRNVSGTGPLTLTILEDNFQLPGGAGSQLNLTNDLTVNRFYNANGTVSTSNVDLVSAYATADPALAQTSTVTATTSSTPFGGSSWAYFNRTADNYQLSQTLTVNLEVGHAVDFQANAAVVAPAPAGLVLAATAVPFVGLLRRRLRKEASVG